MSVVCELHRNVSLVIEYEQQLHKKSLGKSYATNKITSLPILFICHLVNKTIFQQISKSILLHEAVPALFLS